MHALVKLSKAPLLPFDLNIHQAPWLIFPRFAIFVNFATLQGAPLEASFKFSSTRWRFFTAIRFAFNLLLLAGFFTLRGRLAIFVKIATFQGLPFAKI